jgi:hypothetical protein
LHNIALDPPQVEAVEKLKNGNILCGGTGSGKSRVSLAYYKHKICKSNMFRKTYNSYSFSKEFYHVPLYIITTAKKRDTGEWLEECLPFAIVPEKVDSWNNITEYADVTDAFFIFDEQRASGYGVWAKTFIKIAKHNKWILLSATPGDYWMDYLAVFIANGFYANKREFESRHIIYSRFSKFPKPDKYLEEEHLRQLRKKILVDIRYKRETHQNHLPVNVNYDKKLYLETFQTRWNPFTDKPILNISDMCYTLRKIVNTDPSRIKRAKEIIDCTDRIIVFYNFDYELELLKSQNYNKPVAEWNGHKHDDIPNTDKWVYLVQYTAGAEGWNCITTNSILFYSQSYSYKATVQAAGRIDRRNTKYTELMYYHIQSVAPIDVAISRALKRKKKFNQTSFMSKQMPDLPKN